MVAARISRQAVEVVSAEPASARATRLDTEVATLRVAANTVDRVRASRMSVEVVGPSAVEVFVTRLDSEIAALRTPTTTGRANISRQSAEIVSGEVSRADVTRLDSEIAALRTPLTSGFARISRQTAEVIARQGSGTTVVPLPLAAGIEVFLHNWVNALTLHTRYVTDVTISASTGAESRRGLVLKPERAISFVWEMDDKDRLDRLLVMLRKLTDEPVAVPLYCDQKELNAAYSSLDTTVLVDTTKGRWFLGARIVIIQFGAGGQYLTHSFHLVQTKSASSLTFTAPLGIAVLSNAIIMPMMDCDITLEAKMKKETDCLGRVELDLAEIFGASQLPAVKADFPTNAQFFGQYPIFTVEPDWINGIEVGRDRAGKTVRRGRSEIVSTSAARSRQTHELFLSGDRDDMWPVVEFFDTRRGRLRNFILVDKEYIWTVSDFDVTGDFVGINEQGDFLDFEAELLGGMIGIVMKDGTVYVRDVITTQQILTVFRVTVDPPLPSGLLAANVDHVARARHTRFNSDEMVEEWLHPCYMSTDLSFIETLEEKIVDT
jgi:hypothetical protein